MTRKTTALALALAIGVLLGLTGAQVLPIAQAKDPETIIKTEGGVIVFLVEGHEKARIDATGLHVNGDLEYTGALTDTVYYILPEGKGTPPAGANP